MIAGVRRTRGERSGDGPATLRRYGERRGEGRARASGVPRRVHLGRGHGGAPDRGRQRQQRLVGLGAQPRFGHRGVERRCLRFVHPLARGRGPGGRARPVRLPLLARMEPDRTGRRGVLPCRARALPAHLRRLRGEGIRPVVTFHHFTTPLWLAAVGGWEAPDAPDCFAAT